VRSTRVAILGAPSSAAAYAPGQERAPQALRDCGLVPRLAAAGVDVRDLGDLPGFMWRPDRVHPRAQNAEAVVAAAAAVRDAVAGALAGGEAVLVLGGDCTVGVGTVAGAIEAAASPGLVYLDMHADLNVPESVPDGALDWMGMAHMLAVEGCLPALRDIGASAPLLAASQVAVLGHEPGQATDWERGVIAGQGVGTVSADALRADPFAAAAAALAILAEADLLLVHFDVDVVDFVDAPLSENPGRHVGVPLESALAALRVLLADPRAAALTITELNPLHAEAAPGCLERLVEGVVGAISG
jgi:arginase